MAEPNPPENRNINTGGGNYNERIEGDYIQGNLFKRIILSVFQWTNNIFIEQTLAPVGDPARPENQRQLLADVKQEVSARLKQSLHNAVLINLGKEAQPQQVKRPWDADIKIGLKPAEPLPDTTTILEVFNSEEIAGKLLILGNPGSGKTTTQLELAQELIKRAEEQPDCPVPVLFNLSSWKDDRQSLADWLVVELKSKYGVSKKLGQEWVNNRQLLPLLDGLDELESQRQELCVQLINQFLASEIRPLYLVVCSRIEEYINYSTQLQLNGAICIQPLRNNQIGAYLGSIKYIELWSTISSDVDLLELVKTPLLLSITILASKEISVEEWQYLKSTTDRLQYLLDVYILRMLTRDINSRKYFKTKPPNAKKTRMWLVWLAQQLQREAKTEFLIEEIQPYCLKSKLQKIIYRLNVSFITWLLGIPFICVVSSINVLISYTIKNLTITSFPRKYSIECLNNEVLYCKDTSIAFELLSHFTIIQGTILAIIILFILGLQIAKDSQIKTIEGFNWSLKKARYKLASDLLFFIIIIWLISIQFGRLISRFLGGLILGINYLLIILFIAGLNITEVKFKTIPNHGIWKSAINAGFFGMFAELSFWLVVGLGRGQVEVRVIAHTLLPSIVLLSCFSGGAKSLLQHFVLRLILYYNGYIPWNYSRFLDYCTERLFLQRVGGRYRFIHKMLQDHFAQMEFKRD